MKHPFRWVLLLCLKLGGEGAWQIEYKGNWRWWNGSGNYSVTEAIGWTVAVDFAKNARKEWDRKRSVQEAADAYAEAEYYKSKSQNSSDVNEEAEDFGE